MQDEPRFRIGELSRRSGVSPELLRAWERRYGLLRPVRSAGGLRLYTLDDLARVQAMRERLAGGLAAAEAAAAVLSRGAESPGSAFDFERAREELIDAALHFDDAAAHAVIDDSLAAVSLDAFLSELVLPVLEDIGDRWQRGELSVACEHFASNLVRARLLGLARGWGRGFGLRAVLACAPGEQHDIALIAFGLALREHGWRIAFLGADTPMENIAEAARAVEADLVVVSATTAKRLHPLEQPLRTLARRHRVALAGPGAEGLDIRSARTETLTEGPVAEAERVALRLAAVPV